MAAKKGDCRDYLLAYLYKDSRIRRKVQEIGEKMKIFVAMQWPDTPGPYYLFAGKCATIYKI